MERRTKNARERTNLGLSGGMVVLVRPIYSDDAPALAEAIPEAKLRVLDDADHLVFIERFADVNREVVTFLKPRKRRPHRPPAKRKPQERLKRAEGLKQKISSLLKPCLT